MPSHRETLEPWQIEARTDVRRLYERRKWEANMRQAEQRRKNHIEAYYAREEAATQARHARRQWWASTFENRLQSVEESQGKLPILQSLPSYVQAQQVHQQSMARHMQRLLEIDNQRLQLRANREQRSMVLDDKMACMRREWPERRKTLAEADEPVLDPQKACRFRKEVEALNEENHRRHMTSFGKDKHWDQLARFYLARFHGLHRENTQRIGPRAKL